MYRIQKILKDDKIIKYDKLFADTADTAEECTEQYKKRECLKRAVSKGKLLGSKNQSIHESVDKASDGAINKAYAEHKQRELNEKGEEELG